ncbi:glycoside hydrolase family 32 protein [Arundinibacter roseus]|uniref:Glycoside hydrolase family 32 protein n=1 Tax=Arundinibacter roseus TaxID=2070510 RepID=A0A4R4K364_9BACT|nr:glycoside hydrolase family 32 protein [Arundinibacter roseus]TDB61807.1 glycoside hydrolase family 32 protein [Arundinibacter roseus]
MWKLAGLAALAQLTLFSCQTTNTSSPSDEQTVREEYRPSYHFTAPQNWINDPNGLVYLDGEYHLFYQHNPFGNEWGHMSWGHAVSKDLITWEHLPLALPEYPTPGDTSTQTMVFSGSAVVDSANTSGFFAAGQTDGLVAIFTSHVHNGKDGLLQHQSLGYSADKGRTWKLYDKNPVLDLQMKDFRDPNVFWYAQDKKWIMSVVKPLEFTVQFYQSPNLKDWTFMSEFGRQGDTTKIWECPALFPIPVEGTDQQKWLLLISSGHRQKDFLGMQYFVGDFDGKTFVPQPQKEILYVDEGKDFYAAIPFNNLPASHKKPLIVGWLNDWVYANALPSATFKGAMSAPRELSLAKTGDGFRLIQQPVALTKNVEAALSEKSLVVEGEKLLDFTGESYELVATIEPGKAKNLGIKLLQSEDEATVLTYDVPSAVLLFDRTKSGNTTFHERFSSVESMPAPLINGRLKVHILVDASVVEVFVNDGQRVMTNLVFPKKHEGKITLFSTDGAATFREVRIAVPGTK